MKLMPPRAHRYLDFLVVAIFALAPSVLRFSGMEASISYGLAIAHLAVTMLTSFPAGPRRPLPMPYHGMIELIVGVGLLALPWLLRSAGHPNARNFYLGMGVIIVLTWLGGDYRRAWNERAG